MQLEEQKKQQVRLAASCKSKPPSKRASKRPRLQRPASTTTTTVLSSPVGQQPQFTVLSPISLSSITQPFSMAGLPIATLAQSPSAVTLLPAGSQVFTRYMVTGDAKSDTFTLHPSSGLTLVGAASVQDSGQLLSPLELVQLSQQAGGAQVVPLDGQVVDGAVLVQQDVMQAEVEAGQQHTVIEINPMERGMGVMELRLDEEASRERAPAEDAQGGQTEELQGLQLDASGRLSTVQIVVLGDNCQGDNRVKETQ